MKFVSYSFCLVYLAKVDVMIKDKHYEACINTFYSSKYKVLLVIKSAVNELMFAYKGLEGGGMLKAFHHFFCSMDCLNKNVPQLYGQKYVDT